MLLLAMLLSSSSRASPDFTVDLSSPTRSWHKGSLECVGSSHMAMGLLVNNSGSGPKTAAGMGQQARVGGLWRERLNLVRDELGMKMFRGHGLFDDDVGIYQGVACAAGLAFRIRDGRWDQAGGRDVLLPDPAGRELPPSCLRVPRADLRALA